MKLPQYILSNVPYLRSAQSVHFDFLNEREQFIPYRVDILLERMLADPRLTTEERSNFERLRKMLGDRFHYEFRCSLEQLKNDFVPFDPDCETLCEPTYTAAELEKRRIRLLRRVKKLLRISNYTELTSDQLMQCLNHQPLGGLSVHVDTKDFDEFKVYYRGIRFNKESDTWFFFWNLTRPVTVLNRVFVVARFKQSAGGQIIVKLFKELAVENLKIIAPKVKLGMPIFDRIKIGGTVFGSLATTLYKLFVAFTLSWWLVAIIVSSLVIAAFKGLMSFLGSRTKYMQVFSSSLYFRSLSSNKAAITSLIDAAEEQEVKESLLAYFILYTNHDKNLTIEELDREVEHWLEEQFGLKIDFEVEDAIRKLQSKNIFFVKPSAKDGKSVYKVYDLPSTLRRLDEAWDNFNSDCNNGHVSNDRLADSANSETVTARHDVVQ